MKQRQAGLRIVFTQNKQTINIIEIIAIGKREDKKVYKRAEHRWQLRTKN